MNFSSEKYKEKFEKRVAKRRPYSQKCCIVFKKENVPHNMYIMSAKELFELLDIDAIKLKVKETDRNIVVMFNVHEKDIPKIASEKKAGTPIRYIEDMLNPQNNPNFPKKWEKYMTWDPTIPEEVLKEIKT